MDADIKRQWLSLVRQYQLADNDKEREKVNLAILSLRVVAVSRQLEDRG